MRSYRFISVNTMRGLLAVLVILSLAFAGIVPASAGGAERLQGKGSGMVYTQTNAAGGNEIVVFRRAADGALVHVQNVATGGLGSGAGLGSQESLVLDPNGRFLFTVNAGSDQISVFNIRPAGLQLADLAASGGDMPISLALHGNTLYALNAGAPGNITGFWVSPHGMLTPIPGSTRLLSNLGAGDSTGPAQVSFTPDGQTLVVTEKATNLILTYAVSGGVAGDPVIHPSAGATPFGFGFNKRGVLIVSEAFGGAPDASALSSYNVGGSSLDVISPSVATTQTAACWIAVSKNGKYAYTTNTGSSSISSYRVGKDGSLTLLEAVAGYTGDGSRPADMAYSRNGLFLYAINGGTSTISIFRQQADGSLAAMGVVGVPQGSVGLVAR